HHTDRGLLQRHVQSDITLHRSSPSLRGHMRMASYVPGELIPSAFVWLDPGITPYHRASALSFWNIRKRHANWISPRRTRALPALASPFSRLFKPLSSGNPVSPA